MRRLIDADALLLWLVKMLAEFDDDNDPHEIKREMFQCVLSKVRKMPVVDAAPVIRCNDCEYSYFADNRVPAEQSLVCERTGCDVTPDWFCAAGWCEGGRRR